MRNVEYVHPLAPLQRGMLFHTLYAPEAGMYVVQERHRIEGDLRIDAFRRAWADVMSRHDVLRSSFVWENVAAPVQVVHRDVELPIEVLDWRALRPDVQARRIDDLLEAQQKRGFDLTQAPLMRLTVIRLQSRCCELIWCYHHLILDRWSKALLLKEVAALYLAHSQGRTSQLPPAPPFRQYVAWLHRQDLRKAETFWRQRLKGAQKPTRLPQDRAPGGRTPGASWYDSRVWHLPPGVAERVRLFGRRHDVTLSTMMHATWAMLLARYTADPNVLFGTVVSGRPSELSGIEAMVGSLINTLPVRARVEPHERVGSWVERFQQEQVELQQYAYSPLVDVHGWSEVPRGLPIFETLVLVENTPPAWRDGDDAGAANAGDAGLRIGQQPGLEQFHVPLNLFILTPPGVGGIGVQAVFDTIRYDAGAVERILVNWETLLDAVVTDPDTRIDDLPLLTETERRQCLSEWNETAAPCSVRSVQVGIEAHAAQRSDAIAVIADGHHLSYRELNCRANRVAHLLRERGVGPEVLVGLCIDRTIDLAIAVLGVVKSGGAYVPFDPDWPVDRLAFVMEDAAPSVLVTTERLADALPAAWLQLIRLDTDTFEIASYPDSNPPAADPDDLAYVIYTSGSTGVPKGAMVTHAGLANLAAAQCEAFRIRETSRVLQFASLVFDAAVSEWSTAWLAGAALVLMPREAIASPAALMAILQAEAITTATLPPSLVAVMPDCDLPALDTLVVAGEACTGPVVCRWSRGRSMLNAYGPTETTVCATVSTPLSGDAPPPIGRPIANVQTYVVDAAGQPAPIGVPGELFVGGAGVGRGYWQRPALTAERFTPDPWSGRPGARLYRTGDLVSARADGTLEFMRRRDGQVKLRGYRIELGEIEATLRRCGGVRDVAVLLREDDLRRPQLVAYVVGDVDVADLRASLHSWLPEYMIPAAWVTLDRLPMTVSGKVDRANLPQLAQPSGDSAPATPLTQVGELVAGIWSDVLKCDHVGADDDFFALGGHSLIATQVSSRVRQMFDVDLPVRQIFETPRLRQLSAWIEARRAATPDDAPALVPVADTEPLPLSFAQQRLWFIDQLLPRNPTYNLATALRLRGSIRLRVLTQALSEIVRRHEILRTRFIARDGVPFQVIEPTAPFQLPVVDLTALPADSREHVMRRLARREASQPFDLGRAPLLRATVARLRDDERALLCTSHHIASDAWSLGILIRELSQLYAAFSDDLPSPLPELPIQYGDYAAWQRQRLQGELLERQLAYWKGQLGGTLPVLALHTDYPRPAAPSSRGAAEHFWLPAEQAARLQALARDQGVTLFMLLLAAFQVLLARHSGQTDILVGSPIAGRTRVELESLIGFFINTLVFRTDLSGGPTVSQVLQRVREFALGAYAHQDLPFEKLVDELPIDRDPTRNPLFQATFMLENTPVASLRLASVSFQMIGAENEYAHFDLSLAVRASGAQLGGSLNYRADLFAPATVQRMLAHWRMLLDGMAADPQRRINELPLFTPAERQQLLAEWARTVSPYPRVPLHALIETRVAEAPDRIAVVCGDEQLTYGELNARANQLARTLRRRGVGPEVRVGLAVERSIDMAIGLLGVLKGGGAYVPLDPRQPEARLAYFVEDSDAALLVTQQHVIDALALRDRPHVCLDRDAVRIAGEDPSDLDFPLDPDHLAYVIYTSGSTGLPKGAPVEHDALVNYSQSIAETLALTPDDRVFQFASLGFDVLGEELFPTWASGGAVVVPVREKSLSAPADLWRLIEWHSVTVVELPTTYWRQCVEALLDDARPVPLSLRIMMIGGETVSAEWLRVWAASGVTLLNMYGLTEMTITSLCHEFTTGDASAEVRSTWCLGRPIANTQVYLLDAAMEPVPLGAVGQLFVGGAGLARGYWNRPALTAERFVPDPFGNRRGARLFKTGDVARHGAGGELDFLGRRDHQVRVRGFRVELGEIAAALEREAGVRQAIVRLSSDSPDHAQLVAYIVTEPHAASALELRESIARELPDYMVPASIVVVDEFPLTANGKIDIAALPLPTPERDSSPAPPRNAVEEVLAGIWAEVLGLDRVDVEDNFFHLGGHSLLATQVVSRVRKLLHIDLPLYQLFEKPTIAELAAVILPSVGVPASHAGRIAGALLEAEGGAPDEHIGPLLVEGR